MEYCTDRESYSLAAGLALGMVCLGVSAPPTHRTFLLSYVVCLSCCNLLDVPAGLSLCGMLFHSKLSKLTFSCHLPTLCAALSLPPSIPSLCWQHGSNLIGMTDLNVPEQLYQYMVGGHRRAQAGANRERHKSPSYQIKVKKMFFCCVLLRNSCQRLQKFSLHLWCKQWCTWCE